MLGLDQFFALGYEMVHWTISWLVPQYGVIEAQEMGVKVTGSKVTVLEPGSYWMHRQTSQVYTDNVRRKVREPSDVIATTKDGHSVRVGISLAFVISNIKTWLMDNEDAEDGLLVDVQRVILKFVRTHDFDEIQTLDENVLTKLAQKELGRYFGVQVKQLGITTFAVTECRDLNHSVVIQGTLTEGESE